MEEIVKSLQEKYVEDIRAKYPIHRILCLYACIVAYYLSQKCDSLNLLDSLKDIKITFLIGWEGGFFSSANAYQLIVAVFMVAIISRANSYFKASFFELIAKITDLNGYIKRLRESINTNKTNVPTIKKMVQSVEDKKAVLKAMQARSEIMIVCLVCLLINMNHIDLTEIVICILLVWGVIDQQWECYKYYLSKFIPHYVAYEIISGMDSSEAQISTDAFK